MMNSVKPVKFWLETLTNWYKIMKTKKLFKLFTLNGTEEIEKDYELLLEMAGVQAAIINDNDGRKNTGKGFLYREGLKLALPLLQAKYADERSS